MFHIRSYISIITQVSMNSLSKTENNVSNKNHLFLSSFTIWRQCGVLVKVTTGGLPRDIVARITTVSVYSCLQEKVSRFFRSTYFNAFCAN